MATLTVPLFEEYVNDRFWEHERRAFQDFIPTGIDGSLSADDAADVDRARFSRDAERLTALLRSAAAATWTHYRYHTASDPAMQAAAQSDLKEAIRQGESAIVGLEQLGRTTSNPDFIEQVAQLTTMSRAVVATAYVELGLVAESLEYWDQLAHDAEYDATVRAVFMRDDVQQAYGATLMFSGDLDRVEHAIEVLAAVAESEDTLFPLHRAYASWCLGEAMVRRADLGGDDLDIDAWHTAMTDALLEMERLHDVLDDPNLHANLTRAALGRDIELVRSTVREFERSGVATSTDDVGSPGVGPEPEAPTLEFADADPSGTGIDPDDLGDTDPFADLAIEVMETWIEMARRREASAWFIDAFRDVATAFGVPSAEITIKPVGELVIDADKRDTNSYIEGFRIGIANILNQATTDNATGATLDALYTVDQLEQRTAATERVARQAFAVLVRIDEFLDRQPEITDDDRRDRKASRDAFAQAMRDTFGHGHDGAERS